MTNIAISSMPMDAFPYKCFFSIFTTLVFHYLSFLAILLRAIRIYKVFEILDEHWKLMKELKFSNRNSSYLLE
jgi:hypothetical protein